MTTNQIAYFKAKIDERHYNNLDVENQRHNVRSEMLSEAQLTEQQRANLVKEAQTSRSLTETELRDREQATQTWADLDRKLHEAQANVALTNAKTEYQHIQNALEAEYGRIDRVFNSNSYGAIVGTVIKAVDYLGLNNEPQMQEYLNQYSLTLGTDSPIKLNQQAGKYAESALKFSNGTKKTSSNSYDVARATNNLSSFYASQYGKKK